MFISNSNSSLCSNLLQNNSNIPWEKRKSNNIDIAILVKVHKDDLRQALN